jgi:ABC-type uncharacterized transport system permease subunit
VDLDMSERYTLDAIIRIIVYGVPGLLITLGFFAYLSGSAIELAIRDVGMKNFGIVLIVLGIMFYFIEFVLSAYAHFSES